MVQEALGWDGSDARSRIVSTVMTLLLPAFLVFVQYTDPASGAVQPAWRAVWPVFGATNQLLAALALLSITVWLKRTGRSWIFAAAPMLFMLLMTMSALVMLIAQDGPVITRTISAALFVLGLMVAVEAAKAFRLQEVGPEPVTLKAAAAGGD